MFECTPEKGRGTTEYGHPTDRARRNLFWQECSVPGLSRRTHIKFWVIFGPVTECLTVFLPTSSGSLFSIPPAGDILTAVVPAYRERREDRRRLQARPPATAGRQEQSATTSVSDRRERRCAERARAHSEVGLSGEVSVSEHRSTGGVSA